MKDRLGRSRVLLAVLLVVLAFSAGRRYESWADARGQRSRALFRHLVASIAPAAAPGKTSLSNVDLRPLETFAEVFSNVIDNYYQDISAQSTDTAAPAPSYTKLTQGAIRGMLASLGDPYTRFMDPKDYRQFVEENSGHFEGIGATLVMREVPVPAAVRELAQPPHAGATAAPLRCPVCGADLSAPKLYRITIMAPLPGSPAEKAHLQAGDYILAVGEVPTEGMTLDEAVRLIKGPARTKVTLTIGRPSLSKPFPVEVERRPIDVPGAEYKMLPGRIGYLRLASFSERTVADTEKAFADLKGQGMRALLLDLRNNPGGALSVCLQVAGLFVGEGPLVLIQERGQQPEAQTAARGARRIGYPLVVLVNEWSASAAEILAGAIQDRGVGKLVGVKTFGKGLVQTVIPLRDNESAVAISTARYFTPKGHDVNEHGITPDAVVKLDGVDIQPLSEKDLQAQAGITLLREAVAARAQRAEAH